MRARTKLFLGGYVVLLVLSHLVRSGDEPPPRAQGPNEGVVSVQRLAPGAGGLVSLPGEIGVFFRRYGQPVPGEPPVLLLHGSPGDGEQLDALARELGKTRAVLVPDLPGFGRSQQPLPDYSIEAHAGYVRELCERLSIARVDLLGFSMGGGVALALQALDPDRVRSLTMVSAIGVVELELFGEQRLNHVVHAAQRILIWALLEGLPHFGALDDWMLSHAYARNFTDSDQRPLRGILERYQGPLLLLHGEADVLVPVAAAREHARLVPQAELELYSQGHFLVFQEPRVLAERIERFLDDVDTGRARTRAQSSAERLARSREPFDPRSVAPLGGFALGLFMLLAVVATFVSEDLTCIGVGALVAQGRVPLLAGSVACLIGITLGDVLLFAAGRTLGRRALRRAPWSWFLSEERVAQSSEWFVRRGPIVILVSRLLPGTRLPTYFAAGVLRTSFPRFLGWFLLAACLWTPTVVWLSARLGEGLSERLEPLQRDLLLAALLTIGLGLLFLRGLLPLCSRRGRRLRAVWLRRWKRWEFWPLWLFYAPVVGAVLWWTLRARCRPLFTAANPALPHGGFVGESKGAILRALAGTRTPPMASLPHATTPSQRLSLVDAFLREYALELPVVVKPDVGERGDGVHICYSREELEAALEAERELLVQAFVPGREFGAFYARRPGEPRGRILSLTEKHLPQVVGDGVRNLEALIFDDERASFHARRYLRVWSGRLAEVPAAGERIRLGELGTHCRGATFLDGAEHVTPELEGAVDELSHGFEGFHFGRYDLRAASLEDFRRGRFQVLELNGVTSEMAHVYDPRYSALDAWRTLLGQWRLAFEIGAANAARGARVSRLSELLRTILGRPTRQGKRSASFVGGGAKAGEGDT